MIELEKYKGRKTRHTCPSCGKRHTFTRYIDEQGNYIADHVGRCDRESKCGYHYKPKDYYSDNNIERPKPTTQQPKDKPVLVPPSFIDFDVAEQTGYNFEENNFVRFLFNQFNTETANRLVQNFFIGTSNHWQGSTVFWQFDIDLNIRTGKIMLFNAFSGKRIKAPIKCVSWVHSVLSLPDFNLQQCLFGEHQLRKYNGETIGLVESEKTAVIASGFYPEMIWLATGGKRNNLNRVKELLRGENVVLFPDTDAIDLWNELPFPMCNMKLFEGKPSGYDLADLIINSK